MTVIAGFVDKKTGKVFIGADSGLFDDNNHFVSPEPKIIKKPIGGGYKMIIGNQGDVRALDLVLHWKTGKLGYNPEVMTPKEFMVQKFVPAMRELFYSNDYKKGDWTFLVGFDGEIFEICEDFSVTIPAKHGVAIGSAGIPALAALYLLNKTKIKMKPKQKIKLAIETSINISNFAKPPILILSV
jgi:ATP-dependent protease HslVU (ClpYQ) peptidase subunit